MSTKALPEIKVPGWLAVSTEVLMHEAEALFTEAKSGKQRKRWVKDRVAQLIRAHDIPSVPDWLEHPLEGLFIEFVIEGIFAISFRRRTPAERQAIKTAKAKAKAARKTAKAARKAARAAKRSA